MLLIQRLYIHMRPNFWNWNSLRKSYNNK